MDNPLLLPYVVVFVVLLLSRLEVSHYRRALEREREASKRAEGATAVAMTQAAAWRAAAFRAASESGDGLCHSFTGQRDKADL